MGMGTGDLGMGVTFSLRDDATAPARQAGQSIVTLDNQISNAAQSITKASGLITSGIIAITATAALLVAPFAHAVNEAAKFEYTIREAYAKGAATNEMEVQRLRDQAMSLGEASLFSAQMVAEGQVIMAQSGFQNYQIMKALPEVLDLATAGGLGMARATLIASDTMFQFNLRAKDFKRIADVLTIGANESSQSVEDLAQALKYIGPTAKALNIPLEETVAYTEMMAQAGMRGTLGARAFGSALTALAGGNKAVTQMLQSIGVDPFNTPDRSFVGLINLVRQLSKALDGRTQEEQAKILKRLFGAEAFQEINQLLHGEIEIAEGQYVKAADAMQYYADHNNRAFDTARKTAHMMLDTLQGDFKILSSTWKTTLITIGEQFQDVLRPLIQGLSGILHMIQEIVKTPFGKWALIIAGALGIVVTALVAMNFIIAILIPAIYSMVAAGIALVIELWPVFLAVGAIAGIVYIAVRAFDEFKKALNTGEVHGGFIGQLEKIGAVIYSLMEVWGTWNGQSFSLSQGNVDMLERLGLKDFVLGLATWVVRIKEIWKGFKTGFLEGWGELREAFMEMKSMFTYFLSTLTGKDFEKLTGELSLFNEIGKGFAETVWLMLTPIIIAVRVVGLLVAGIASLIELVKNSWDYLKMGVMLANGDYAGAAMLFNIKKMTEDNEAKKNALGITAGNGDKGRMSDSETLDKLAEILARKNAPGAGPVSPDYLKGLFPATKDNSPKGSLLLQLHIDGKKIHEEMVNMSKLQEARK